MRDSQIKVLYIAGWGRSGTTILDNILGQIDGFLSVGELRFIWDRSLIEKRRCGCGAAFRECEVWKTVLDEAFGGMNQINPHEMIRLRDNGARTRHIPLMLSPGGKPLLASRLEKYLEAVEKLYRAIQFTTGSKVIVDSSKYPAYGYVLGMLSAIDLYVVHLIRDPRGVAYSWLRKKLRRDTEYPMYMLQVNPVESSLLWNTWNIAAEAFWRRSPERYLLLRYEDFVDKPRKAVRRILDMVQEKALRLPFVTEREVELGVNHTISGNPIRFQTGTVELRLDNEWETKMKKSDKVIVTALTWPLLLRYGYLGRLDRH